MKIEKIKTFIKKTKYLFVILFIFIIIGLPFLFFSNNGTPENNKKTNIIFSIANVSFG